MAKKGSNKKRGNELEKEAMNVYNKWGFQTWRPANASVRIGTDPETGRPIYINKQQDIAGAFDFIAWDGSEVHLVQVKTSGSNESHPSEARKKIDNLEMSPHKVTQVVLMRIFRKKEHFIAWVLQDFGEWDRRELNGHDFLGIVDGSDI